MKTNLVMRTILLLGVTSGLASCQKAPESPVAAAEPRMFGTTMEKLGGCKGKPETPVRAFVVTLGNPMDLFNVKRNIIETNSNTDGTDTGPDSTPPPLPQADPPNGPYPDGSAPTALDFWLKLKEDPASKRSTVLIKFVLPDSRMTFRNDGYAVAGDSKGKAMLCNLKVAPDLKSATVWGLYHKDVHPGGKMTFGYYNLGVKLLQANGESIPIFIDPAVGNEG